MSISDRLPDYPVSSDLVRRLKSALDAEDEERVSDLIRSEVRHVDAVIELANDDWMKDPAARLPPAALLGAEDLRASPHGHRSPFQLLRSAPLSESWKELIPEDVLQMHQPFYRSLFALAHTPRCLQHLCRCAIRKTFGRKCFDLVPLLSLPKSLQNYLLLEPEGVLH
nr:ankyrin repeat and SOCS box protein 18 [Vicugna pacos]